MLDNNGSLLLSVRPGQPPPAGAAGSGAPVLVQAEVRASSLYFILYTLYFVLYTTASTACCMYRAALY